MTVKIHYWYDNPKLQITELQKRIISNNLHAVEAYLQSNPDFIHSQINKCCRDGWNALHYAAYLGNPDIIKKLMLYIED